jgi:hypothetical protein
MATATQKTAASRNGKPAKPQEATALLRADHKKVTELFAEFEKSRSSKRKNGS